MPPFDPKEFDEKEILFEGNYYDAKISNNPFLIYNQKVSGMLWYIAVHADNPTIRGYPCLSKEAAVKSVIACVAHMK